MIAAAVVEHGKEGRAAIELAIVLVHEINAGRQRRFFSGFELTLPVVFGATVGIGKDVIGCLQHEELFRIAGDRVVRMEAAARKR